MEIPYAEVENNFDRYIRLAQFEDIIVTKNGRKLVVIKSYTYKDSMDNKDKWPDQWPGKDPKKSFAAVAEKAGAYARKNRKIAYEDFLKLSEESENRYEYIDGEVYLLASPSYDHQSIIMEISNMMYNWFKGKKCRPLTTPLDVTLLKHEDKNVVQPDIVVICDPENINEKRKYTGTPALVVEVLSGTSQSKDMLKKLDLYMQGGIREYWIINPFKDEAYLYFFEEYDIRDFRAHKGDEIMRSSIFEGLEIPLGQVFSSTHHPANSR